MRTTVDLPEELLNQAKEHALRGRLSLSQLVQRAVRHELERAEELEQRPFELVVAGQPGGSAPSPREVHELLSQDERLARS